MKTNHPFIWTLITKASIPRDGCFIHTGGKGRLLLSQSSMAILKCLQGDENRPVRFEIRANHVIPTTYSCQDSGIMNGVWIWTWLGQYAFDLVPVSNSRQIVITVDEVVTGLIGKCDYEVNWLYSLIPILKHKCILETIESVCEYDKHGHNCYVSSNDTRWSPPFLPSGYHYFLPPNYIRI